MGLLNLTHRPKVAASSEPGFTIHRTLNDPKVTKPTPKAVGTDFNMDALAETMVKCKLKDDDAPESAGETVQEAERQDPVADAERPEETSQQTPLAVPPATETDDITMADIGTLTSFNRPKVIYKPKAVRTSEETRVKRAIMEEQKLADNAKELAEEVKGCDGTFQETQSTIATDAQADDMTMTDVAPNMALPNNDDSPAADCDLGDKASRKKKRKSAFLKEYMPKAGMLYNDFGRKGNSFLLSKRPKLDWEVLQALWLQQETGDKRLLQALIVPVFNNATLKIQHEGLSCAMEEEGCFQGGDIPEDSYTSEDRRKEEDVKKMWDNFMGEL